MSLEIVTMDAEHIDALEQLEICCFSLPWSRSMLEYELINPFSSFLVGRAKGKVAGYCGCQIVLDECSLMNVAVHPDYRGLGYGKELMGRLLELVKDRQAARVTLEVRASNEAAIGLYRRFGFLVAGKRKNYYERPREDALIMALDLRSEERQE